jgi:hypothetical protein
MNSISPYFQTKSACERHQGGLRVLEDNVIGNLFHRDCKSELKEGDEDVWRLHLYTTEEDVSSAKLRS